MKHLEGMKYLLTYHVGSKNIGLVFGRYEKDPTLRCFVDSDYASSKDKIDFSLGLVVELGENPSYRELQFC